MALKFKITLLALFSSFYFFSQNVIFTFNDDTQIEYGVDQVEKITFNNNFLLLHLTDATVISWDLNIIKNYTHSDSGLSVSINSPLVIADELSLYPNPSSGAIKITYSVLTASDVKILIYDQEGKLCSEQNNHHDNPETKTTDLQLSNLARGIYNCVIECQSHRVSKKFTIQ